MITTLKGVWLAAVLAVALLTTTARANIYATDLKLNGAEPLATSAAFSAINITYVLNEPATLGVTINITSGPKLVRTLTAPAGTQGALWGTNLAVWDGKDATNAPVPTGDYAVSVVPAAIGYTNWTQISHDTNPGNYVFAPRGLAVNNNSNSLFYGRVFVGNAGTGPNASTVPGDKVTILKLNADGSFADEGPDGNGGYGDFEDLGSFTVPEKMRVGDDDRLYMMDLNGYSQLVAFDMLLTTNEIVFSSDNYIENPFWPAPLEQGNWFSMDITDAGTTNGLIWLGDLDSNGAGIWNWHLVNGVADPNDHTGNWAVAAGGSLGVAASGGLMVDTNNDIFVSQYLTDSGDTNADCMVFTNWNKGSAFNGGPVTNGAAWSAGGNEDTFLGVYDTTIDSRQRPQYVACALNGGPLANAAGICILNAAKGANVVTNLDATNQYFATAWDNVGNLYAASETSHLLRVFSPPSGTNQSATLGSLSIESAITGITRSGANLTITFIGSVSDNAGQFELRSSAMVTGPYTAVPGAVVMEISPGQFTVSTTISATAQFYRISE